MKLKNIVTVILLQILFTSVSAFGQAKEVEIKTSAQCNECKEIIEETLMDMKGVKFAELDVESKIVKVAYNEKKTSAVDIKNAIVAVGYNADEQEADPEAVKRLSPCCRPDGTHSDE